ncbi:hypothetical protein HPB47_008090 [Ixodes persulcatus]|uniref:Uncharacterized protein n=1 Tax=Ixodes persulcatus TaxID=34615 RepID=A0AC60P5X4_IXOPE|nr:hypothetical protein HPB47_008090 [Ixodes persulcatus]
MVTVRKADVRKNAAAQRYQDIRQLSPSFQTYSLESFHSVLIGFAPKSAVFTYDGMRARTLLAVLHFNANAKRLQATTKDGQCRYKVKASKLRKDHLAAFQMAEGAKFASAIFREAASELSTPPPPPPMIARVQPRPSKADLVAIGSVDKLRISRTWESQPSPFMRAGWRCRRSPPDPQGRPSSGQAWVEAHQGKLLVLRDAALALNPGLLGTHIPAAAALVGHEAGQHSTSAAAAPFSVVETPQIRMGREFRRLDDGVLRIVRSRSGVS